MPIAFEVEERVDRPPEVVWKRLTDWDAAAEWMDGVDSMTANGPTAVGTTIDFHARGKTRQSEITGLVEGRELTLTSHQGPATADYTYRCEGEDGGTRLHLVATCEVRGPLRLFGPLLRRLIARTDGGQLAALKKVIEAG